MTERSSTSAPGTVVVRVDHAAVDASTYREVERDLRERAPPAAPLVIDWSNVVYVDFLGMEMVFDFLIDRTAAVAFAGMSRDLRHLLLRLQLSPVLPVSADVESAAAAIGIR